MQEALKVAEANELPAAILRAQFNLSGLALEHDRLGEARAYLEDALALARRRGDRGYETNILGQLADVLVALGDWDQAVVCLEGRPEDIPLRGQVIGLLLPHVRMGVARGSLEEVEAVLSRFADGESSNDRQTRGTYLLAAAIARRAQGRTREALAAAEAAVDQWQALLQFHYTTESLVEGVEAALELEDEERAKTLIDEFDRVPPVDRRPLLDAQQARLCGRLASRRHDPSANLSFASAAAFRSLEMQYWLAVTLLEHGEWCLASERAGDAAPLVLEARQIFERLGANRWLGRIDSPAFLAVS